MLKYLLNSLNIFYKYSDTLLLNYYFFLILLSGIYLAFLYNRDYFKTLIKDMRFLRVAHFELMLVLGITIGIKNISHFQLSAENIFSFAFAPAAIFFAIYFSIITNNIQDYEIDSISNKDRPHVSGKIVLHSYEKLAACFLVLALIYSFTVSFMTFFLTGLFISNYYVYSVPPLRIKRIPVLSKLVISVNSLAMVMMGYHIIKKGFFDFPVVIYPIFLIGVTLAANFIDIKDYEGDKQAKISTLPVLIGEKKAKIMIGSFFALCYFAVAHFIINGLFFKMIFFITGIMEFFIITKNKYKEDNIFHVYLSSVIFLIFYIYYRV